MFVRFSGSVIAVAVAAAAVGALVSASVTQTLGQAGGARPPTILGKPNFSGIWQANNEANWDLTAHAALPGAVTQQGVYPFDYARVPAAPVLALGAAGAVPGSLGVVQDDGQIPYRPEALAIKKENAEHWIDRDPELKCYLPGIPRAMYMPYPFEITQSTNKIHIAYEFSNSARTIHLDKVEGPPDDTWMGHSVGQWDGDTLVVDVGNFNDRTWFDRAGDFHSDALHLEERFTLMTPDIIHYEVTIDDPKVFTRPWRIAMPIYRRVEPNMQLIEFRCNEFVEEFMYGGLRKEPLVKHWEGETISIDVTRKVPPGDKFYEWYR
ncbi:MAG TPA: hypothetical protein VKW08_12870 [Xanthobacteraceae bacterium]|jgi:hypothetical protein|nr:hypothetical protein [Xanthobacteraceae bacterium]